MTNKKSSEEDDICCPEFDPSKYSDEKNGLQYKKITWNENEKPFVKDGTYCFMYIPFLSFGRATTRALKKISGADAECDRDNFMILSDCSSPWYSNIYLTCNKDEVKGATVEKISGVFLAKAFEGDYSKTGKWVNDMKEVVQEANEEEKGDDFNVNNMKMYFYYPTCPKCAKKWGKNHVVIMAKIA